MREAWTEAIRDGAGSAHSARPITRGCSRSKVDVGLTRPALVGSHGPEPEVSPMTESPDARTRSVLRENDMPVGLIPDGIVEAELEADGSFSVRLPRRVERKHGGYRVRFGPQISGRFAHGRVTGLQGVEAKQVIWFQVQGIVLKGDKLIFEVGPARVPLPRSAFP